MEKFFNSLSKPAKWVFVIGGFFYATWFAVTQATAIDGQFVNVITKLIIMVVGSALLVAAPILVLLNKNDAAKMDPPPAWKKACGSPPRSAIRWFSGLPTPWAAPAAESSTTSKN